QPDLADRLRLFTFPRPHSVVDVNRKTLPLNLEKRALRGLELRGPQGAFLPGRQMLVQLFAVSIVDHHDIEHPVIEKYVRRKGQVWAHELYQHRLEQEITARDVLAV